VNDVVNIPLDLLDEDEKNVRKQYFGIPLFADSIAYAGILQNLVVVPNGERYTVKAGNKRRRALLHLVDKGRITKDYLVPCRVLSTDGVVESGIENIAREDLFPWEVGEHYLRLIDRGMIQKEIAEVHGKSQQHVSLCVRIARDLAPEVVKRVVNLGKSGPNHIELGRIAEFKDIDTLAPDAERQLQALDDLLEVKKEKKKNREKRLEPGDGKLMMHMRKRLRALIEKHPLASLPPHVRPYWKSFFRYLQGTQELELPDEPRIERRSIQDPRPSPRKKRGPVASAPQRPRKVGHASNRRASSGR
jgi:ParB/RepB/Spo0J family partition protein